MSKLLIIDGNGILYRAFHAFPLSLTAPDGSPTNAAFGFCRILFGAIKSLEPTHLIVAFDVKGPTFRDALYPGYKAQRAAMPAELRQQVETVWNIVRHLEAPIAAAEGYEADDCIGTLARLAEAADPELTVTILSGDQDLIQLVTDRVTVYSPGMAPRPSFNATPRSVQEKYGFAPARMVDYKALRGDPSDNIPGVPGVGEVTAKLLLERYGTLDGLLAALDAGDTGGLKPGVIKKLEGGRDSAKLSFELATIVTDAPITFDAELCRLELLQPEKLVDLFRSLGFRSLLKELPGSHGLQANAHDLFEPAEEEPGGPEEPDSESAAIDRALEPVLRRMETTGALLDVPYLRVLEHEFDTALNGLRAELAGLAGHEFKYDSPKEIAELLYGEMQIPTFGVGKGKTGFTTDAATLGKLEPRYPIAGAILRYRELQKLQGTYVKPLQAMVDGASRVHTSYAADTSTGRLSSRDPNLQNIPGRSEKGRLIRKAFIAPPGWLMVAADYSQGELRVAAHLSGDEAMIGAFRDGRDFHAETAARMGVDRRVAKILNFSILYGKGAFGFANDLGIGMDEAKAYISAYFAAYPQLRAYLDRVLDEARRNGYAETLYGRRRRFPDLAAGGPRRAAAEREAVNLPIQGTQADILKRAMVDLDAALRESGSPARMILTVHDELVLEVPKGSAKEAGVLLLRCMEGAARLVVPMAAELKSGPDWASLSPA